ncbi:MAG: hypothetical protein JSS60_08115 [Verrucomicrobia bacterium]|nr:hypothetical protein [Verrucomicrobiota bacterium]
MGKGSGKKGSASPDRNAKYLGDFKISIPKFENLPRLFKEFQSKEFHRLNEKQKNERVNHVLYDLILKAKTPCFLLPAVIDYIEQVNALKVLESYAFFHFELWLNQFSQLSAQDNYLARAKIAGKWVPRDEFQILFPIGMGKVYPGSHFVTAHGSPDLDTTISSFWGWVDAFTARVSDGLHLWNIPGGAPTSQIEIKLFFNHIFGDSVFNLLAKTRTTLALSGIDLMTQKGLVRKQTSESTQMIDHERTQNAIVLVDDEGYYLGDWRNFDVEGVRQVIMMLNNCLRWFENHLHVKLIALFAKEKLSQKDIPAFIKEVFLAKLGDCQPAKEFTEKQRKYTQDYLCKVLGVKKGLDCTIEEFAKAMKDLSLFDFQEFVDLVESMHKSHLFDRSGALVENRSRIFNYLEKIIKGLDNAIQSVRTFVERLDVALSIKTNVFGYLPQSVSYRADVDEIKSKMGNYPYLSVTATDKGGKLIPLGIVHSQDLHQPLLGTVTLRDFCNREETKIPSYLEVISVIDHHKSSLQTSSAPMAIIADAQSSNVLCAEMAFAINDRFGTGGMTKAQIDKQTASLGKNLSSSQSKRLMTRLIQKQLAAEENKGFFIDSSREYLEYLHFLYGILDDTDLLTKVSQRDVECVAQLINRLKSIMLQTQVEVITLSDIPRDKDFVRKASARILQNSDMYSLYRKIYLAKEDAVEENIALCAKGQESSFFDDTKEQNGCARVGQFKLFARNYPVYSKYSHSLRKRWYDNGLDFYRDRQEVDLHMQMISTIAGAEDLFAGTEGDYKHQDELWLWIPFTEQSIEHLKGFLNAFRSSPQIQKNGLSVEFYGDKAKAYEQIFAESFLPIPKKITVDKNALSIAVLKYKAGLINSRKAMISPYLPKLVE